MSTLAHYQSLIAQEVAVTDDMNEKVVGGPSRLLETGRYFGYVAEYIDLGNQPQEFQGKAKDPAPEIQLGLWLLLQDPDTRAWVEPTMYRPYSMAISRNEKAGAFKAFKALNWRQDPNIRHFAQFLGQAFIFDIVKYKSTKGKDANKVQWDKTVAAVDPMSGQPYPLPGLPEDKIRLFLWNNPDLFSWDSLYVEGVWDDGQSKNRLQETILSATNFSGSPLELLLLQNQRNTQAPPKPVVAAPAQAAAAPVAAVAAPVQVAPAAVAQVPVQAPQVAPVAVPSTPAWEAPVAAPLAAPAAPAVQAAPIVQAPAAVAVPAASAPQFTAQPPASTAPTASPSEVPQAAAALPPAIPGQAPLAAPVALPTAVQ